MSDPKAKQKSKEMLSQAMKDLPAAAVGYGLGYGIGRTAMEAMMDNPSAMGMSLQKYLPPIVGAGAAYAAVEAGRALTDKKEGKKAKR